MFCLMIKALRQHAQNERKRKRLHERNILYNKQMRANCKCTHNKYYFMVRTSVYEMLSVIHKRFPVCLGCVESSSKKRTVKVPSHYKIVHRETAHLVQSVVYYFWHVVYVINDNGICTENTQWELLRIPDDQVYK